MAPLYTPPPPPPPPPLVSRLAQVDACTVCDDKHHHELEHQFLRQNLFYASQTIYWFPSSPTIFSHHPPPPPPSTYPPSPHTLEVVCFLNLTLQQLPPPPSSSPLCLPSPLPSPSSPSLPSFTPSHLLYPLSTHPHQPLTPPPFHPLTFGTVCFVCFTAMEAVSCCL